MKKFSLMVVYSCLLVLVSLNFSCDIFGPTDPIAKTKKDAWTTIINAHAAKQHFYNEFFRINSNNYKRDQLFVYEPKESEIDYLWNMFFEVLSYADDVDAAVDTLLALALEDGLPLAKSNATTSVFGALADFFGVGKGVNVKNRQRLLLIASNMTKADKDQLYDELVIDKWKSDIGTADEFWSKLQSGALDDKASTLYKNFYDGANSILNPFTYYANQKNLTPGKTLSKDGLELCNKGLDVVIETAGTIVPGLSKAKDILDDSKDLIEKSKKMVDKPLDAIADEIKSRAINKVSGIADVDNYFDPEGAGKYVKILAEVSLGTDDPDELVEQGINYGIAKLKSSDRSIKPDYAIAKNTSPTSGIPDFIIGVGNYVQQTQEFIMNLPSGNWDITAKDKSGQTSSSVPTSIASQQAKTVNISSSSETNSNYLDSLAAILQTMPYMNIYLNFGDHSIYVDNSVTASIRFPLTWSSTSFGQSFRYTIQPSEGGGTQTAGTIYDCSISGNLTLVSYDRIGVSLTAHRTIEEPRASNDPTPHRKYMHDISISGLPFAYFAGGLGAGFDIDSYSNSEYQASISSIASFTYREIAYEYSTEQGAVVVASDTSYTEITTSDPRLRVYFFK